MGMTTVSDPSAWCFAELDGSLPAEDLDRFLSGHEAGTDAEELPEPAGAEPPDAEAARGRLLEGMEMLDSTLAGWKTVVPSRRVVRPVLELWEMADAIDSSAAAPLERLLSHLTGRRHTTTDEVAATLAEVRLALAEFARS